MVYPHNGMLLSYKKESTIDKYTHNVTRLKIIILSERKEIKKKKQHWLHLEKNLENTN